MKMDRAVQGSMIDKANHSFFTSLHAKRRSWRYTIVTNQVCFAQVGVHLLLKGLDFDLVVVDNLSSSRIGPCAVMRQLGIKAQLLWTYYLGSLFGGIGRGRAYISL